MFKRAKDLERRGQWKKAYDIFSEIIAWKPTDSYAHLALAKLEARRSPDSEKACAAFQKGAEACPDSVHILQAWAVYEDSNGNTERAKELFEQCLFLDPQNPYACHAYGLMERKRGNFESARHLWNQGLERESTAALVCQMGELLVENKELGEARTMYAKHVELVKTAREKTEIYLASAWLEERYYRDVSAAEEMIESALRINPSSSKARIALARLEARQSEKLRGNKKGQISARRLADACLMSENNDDVKHEDGRVYNAWASTEIRANRLDSAREILQRGLSLFPKDHSLIQAAGSLEEKLGNHTGARMLYSESLRVQPSAPALVAFAMHQLRYPPSGTANLTEARQLFEEALLLGPRHGPAYNSFGKALLRAGEISEARAIFERGIKARCTDVASVFHGYAQLEISVGNIPKARAFLVKGLEEAKSQGIGADSPHRERTVFLTHTLGMLELNSNHPSKALGVFKDGIKFYGNSSQLLLGAALCEIKLGGEDNARSLFERSVEANDRHAQAWQAWAVMEMRAGNWKTAETLFQCGVKQAPKHGALWLAYAIAEGRMGNSGKARALFASGLSNSPDHAPLYQAWASFELKEERYEIAKALIAEALTRDKRNGSGWRVAAEIERRIGNVGLESLILRRGIECAPTHAPLYRALGDLLLEKGDISEARVVYEKGIEVDALCAPLYHSLAELEARIFNLDGLAALNKRASRVFRTDAVELSPNEETESAWGKRIQASRSRSIPTGIKALAERIVDDEGMLGPISTPSDIIESMESRLLEQLLDIGVSEGPGSG